MNEYNAYVRVFLPSKRRRNFPKPKRIANSRVLVFDTETTNDLYQNLKFGTFRVYDYERLEREGIFYCVENLSKRELIILTNYCRENNLLLLTVHDFVQIFFKEVFELGTLCVGFNLPFDLSRLAIRWGYARSSYEGGFSFVLNKSKKYPRVVIKNLDSTKSFIKFSGGFRKSGRSYFKGNFLDLRTLSFALTSRKHTLSSACELFQVDNKKLTTETHGIVTTDYVTYAIRDTLATYELFKALKKEYAKYELDLPLTELYSPASIGKAYMRKFGIKPFTEKNQGFPDEMLGKVMSTFFGGRSEVRIRKTPTRVVYLDFLSMYPTVCTLQSLWRFIIADKVEVIECTEEVQEVINNISLEKLRNPEIWKEIQVIVKITPNQDILPLRTRYGKEKYSYTVGLNEITSNHSLYYALADVIASKLLTGKTPRIEKAYQFVPVGVQEGLRSVDFFGKKINPATDDFFKEIIEERAQVKQEMKQHPRDSQKYKVLEKNQKILKIIANSTSYGIYAEINTKPKASTGKVFSNESFFSEFEKQETFGKYAHPLMATFITSGSRLILAMVEKTLRDKGENYAFCDTDSMAVTPHMEKPLQELFKPLNPYSFGGELFKLEKENFDDKGGRDELWFYGISAKRYVLFTKKCDDIVVKKHSLHGLGYLTNPFQTKDWQKEVWEDLLKLHYGLLLIEDFMFKYSKYYAISKYSISKKSLMKLFEGMNKERPVNKQVKPFNFMLVGVSNHNFSDVKPVAPYSTNFQGIVFNDFVNYKNGAVKSGEKYWKNLDSTLLDYLLHPESKFEGKNGVLKRKKLVISGVKHIGKESNLVEETGVFGLNSDSYTKYGKIIDDLGLKWEQNKEKILQLKPKEVKELKISRQTLWNVKQRITGKQRGKTHSNLKSCLLVFMNER